MTLLACVLEKRRVRCTLVTPDVLRALIRNSDLPKIIEQGCALLEGLYLKQYFTSLSHTFLLKKLFTILSLRLRMAFLLYN